MSHEALTEVFAAACPWLVLVLCLQQVVKRFRWQLRGWILLLVPGSIGYRSLTLLMNRDILSGVEAGFRMFVTAAALVAGLIMAGILMPAPSLTEDETR